MLGLGKLDVGPLNKTDLEKELLQFIKKLGDDDYSIALFNMAATVFEAVRENQPRINGYLPKNKDLIKNKAFRDEIRKYIAKNKITFHYTKQHSS